MLNHHQKPRKDVYYGTVYSVYDQLVMISRILSTVPIDDKKQFRLMPIDITGEPILLNAIVLPEKFWNLLNTYTGLRPSLDLLTLPEITIKLLTMGLLKYQMQLAIDNAIDRSQSQRVH